VSGCVPPEEYVRLMGEVGFDGARCVGGGVFWTSPTTRSMDFVAVKSAATPVVSAVSATTKKTRGVKAQYVVAVGVAALLAFTVTRYWSKRA